MDDDRWFTRLTQRYLLAEWLFMKEGTKIGASAMFKQNKPVYERLCIHLGIPERGTKQHLIQRLISHEFSTAEKDELQQFTTQVQVVQATAANREGERKTFEKVAAGPRPYAFITHYALTQYDARVAAYGATRIMA